MTEYDVFEPITDYFDSSGTYEWGRFGDIVRLVFEDTEVTLWQITPTVLLDFADAPDPADFRVAEGLSFGMGEDLVDFGVPDGHDVFEIDGTMYTGRRLDVAIYDAVETVAADQRDGLNADELDTPVPQLIAHARNTIALVDIATEPGEVDANADAYRVVLGNTVRSLEANGLVMPIRPDLDGGRWTPRNQPIPAQTSGRYEHADGDYLNSVRGTLYTMRSVNQLREGIADYEQDWITFEVVGLNATRFVYSSEDSTDVVGMLAYLQGLCYDGTGFGGLVIDAFAFGTDRLA